MHYFIANWKANKNEEEVANWFNVFSKKLQNKDAKIILCPAYPFLLTLKPHLSDYKNIELGVQNISIFGNGSYTGEVTAAMLQGLVKYAIVGHSERRINFNEKDEDIEKKIQQAQNHGIEPILCIRDGEDKVSATAKIVAYEPVFAIGTGQNELPDKVRQVKEKMHLKPGTIYIYGGSVDETNIQTYLSEGGIDGFLVGGASLDPEKFARIINLS